MAEIKKSEQQDRPQREQAVVDRMIGVVGIISTLFMFYALIYKQMGTPCGVFGPLMRVLFMSSVVSGVSAAAFGMNSRISNLIVSAFIVFMSRRYLKEGELALIQ